MDDLIMKTNTNANTNAAEYITTAAETAIIKAAAEALANAGAFSMQARLHAADALRPHAANVDGTGGNYLGWKAVMDEGKAFFVDYAAAKGVEMTDSARDTAWSRLVAKTGLTKPKSETSSGSRAGSAGSANGGTGNPKTPRDAAYYQAAEKAATERAAQLAADAEKARAEGSTKSAERIANKAAKALIDAQAAANKAEAKRIAAEQENAEKAEKAEKAKAEKAADTVRAALADKDTAAFLVTCLQHRAAIEMALANAAAEEAGKPITNAKPAGKTRSKPTAKPADPATWSEAV